MSYFQKAFVLAKTLEDKEGMDTALFNQGAILVRQGQQDAGLQLMEQAVNSAKGRDSVNEILPLLEELADAYQIAKRFEKEAATLREFNQLNKKLFKIERDKQLNQLQEEFSAKDQAKQIEVLEQQNLVKAAELDKKHLQQKVLILIALVVLLTSIMLFQLYRRVRNTNSKLRVANDKLAYHSLHDPLTGLLNRRSLHDHMQRKQQLGERRLVQQAEHDGFILLDVDFFKHINDRYGHAAGDVVLIEIGKRLNALTRNEDMVLRWGGEEFLIVLRRIDQAALTQFTQRVLDVIGKHPIEFQGQRIAITISAGFITLPFADLTEEQFNWEKALQLADMALYLGKVHGRNRGYGVVQLHRPYAEIQHQLETDLSKAIDDGMVEVCLLHGPVQEPVEN
jgi:diguanylate cyclase (GGDEF)-like protein